MLESILRTRPVSRIAAGIAALILAGCEPNDPNQTEYSDYYDDPYEGMNVIKLVDYADKKDSAERSFSITGHVKNDSLATKKGTINFILYDSGGNVLATDQTHANPWEMPSAAVHPFEKKWTDPVVYNSVKSYDISTATE